MNDTKKSKWCKILGLIIVVTLLSSTLSVNALTINGVSISASNVYSTSTSTTKIGSIGANENLYIGIAIGVRTYVTYVTSTGSKSGWVSSSAVTKSTWQWPINCMYNNCDFNYSSTQGRGYHMAIDIDDVQYAALDKLNVMAAKDGKVVYAGYSSGNGNHVIIEHTVSGSATGKLYSLYSHLASINATLLANYKDTNTTNDTVSKGSSIGKMGNTGVADGNVHLHFAIYDRNYSTNPYGWTASATGDGFTLVSHTDTKIVLKTGTTTINHYDPAYVIRYGGGIPAN